MDHKYRKKPVVVEAFQLTESTIKDRTFWPDWLKAAFDKPRDDRGAVWLQCDEVNTGDDDVSLFTLFRVRMFTGTLYGVDGDFIVRDESGNIQPCNPATFLKTYEKTADTGNMKLVRHRMPEFYPNGVHFEADDELYFRLLREKIVEEAMEVRDSTTPEKQIEELADVSTVLFAMATMMTKVGYSGVQDKAIEKRSARGDFLKKIVWSPISIAQRARAKGFTVPAADLVIAACAWEHRVELEHDDAHLAALVELFD